LTQKSTLNPSRAHRCLLAQDDLGGPLAVHAEASVCVLQHGAHGLAAGVEGVHLVELLLWNLVPDWLVVPLEFQDQTQQGTLGLVANVAWEASLPLWGLTNNNSLVRRLGAFVCEMGTSTMIL